MEKYLVTGGSGYVGREVVRQLLELGHDVTALDSCPPDRGIPCVQVDLTDNEALTNALGGKTFDRILHLASLPGDTGNPEQMVRVNVNGCLNILEFARRSGVKRFVLTGSISAHEWYPATRYNPPDYMPVDEKHPLRPKDMYSSTKLIQEILTTTYYHQYGVPTTILRLTAVVGPRGSGGGRGYRDIGKQMLEGKRVQIPHFSAEELCHYVDLRDVARMEIVLAEHPAAPGEVFFCAGPKAVTGAEFAQAVKEIVPGIQVEFGYPWSMAQGGRIEFSMEKAKRLLGFEPQYTLLESLRSIYDWVKMEGLIQDGLDKDSTYESGVQAGTSGQGEE